MKFDMVRFFAPMFASLVLVGCANAEPPVSQAVSDNVSASSQVENAETIILVKEAPLQAEAPAIRPSDPGIDLLDTERAERRATEGATGIERTTIPGVFARMHVIEILKGTSDDYIYLPRTSQNLGDAETFLVFIDRAGTKTLEPMTDAGEAKLAAIRQILNQ